ncbi:hypothetical protein FNV43_RR25000 [Rhamnella rubrinervis]|uniref:Uncharacterized protein n=1 Tax=Rhamnella rubrinervis TaxID=2594499 RepID=A0A8K0DZ78_9ROSA|nr:hypothetical protein FNV43_RR25000 [Rhamnella rubrinervis]
MVTKEAFRVEENTNLSQDLYAEEEEETLSLCDLPIHSDSSKWDDVESSSFDNNEDGFFEFFSEDFTASTYPSSGKDIIFCGKLIPYKEVPTPLLPHDHQHQKTQNNLDTNKKKLPTKKGFQLWKSYSFHKLVRSSSSSNSKGSNIAKKSNSKPQRPVKANSMNNNFVYNTRKMSSDHHRNRHLSVGKVSVLSSPAKSSKWYLYMFGIARLPTEMELRDIKTRQSRRSPSTMFAPPEKISTEMVKEKVVKRRSGKGFWGFLRGLSCRSTTSQLPNDVVKGSSGCNVPELCES